VHDAFLVRLDVGRIICQSARRASLVESCVFTERGAQTGLFAMIYVSHVYHENGLTWNYYELYSGSRDESRSVAAPLS
jgi:hypothetical protein